MYIYIYINNPLMNWCRIVSIKSRAKKCDCDDGGDDVDKANKDD